LLRYLQRWVLELVYDETGADLAEYGLILALVVVVAIVVLSRLGQHIIGILQQVAVMLGGG
jgi:Flp pilus assembly pilin Flp